MRERGKALPETGYKEKYVVIYRATVEKSFKENDYVSLSLKWAVGHAEHTAAVEEETCHVLSARVLAADVYEAYNPGEYFYGGAEVPGKVVKTVNGTLKSIGNRLKRIGSGYRKPSLQEIQPAVEAILKKVTPSSDGSFLYAFLSSDGKFRLSLVNNMTGQEIHAILLIGAEDDAGEIAQELLRDFDLMVKHPEKFGKIPSSMTVQKVLDHKEKHSEPAEKAPRVVN